MKKIDINLIKKLREETGVAIIRIREVLEEIKKQTSKSWYRSFCRSGSETGAVRCDVYQSVGNSYCKPRKSLFGPFLHRSSCKDNTAIASCMSTEKCVDLCPLSGMPHWWSSIPNHRSLTFSSECGARAMGKSAWLVRRVRGELY